MPAAERRAVAHLEEAFGRRERRACKAIGSCRMTVRYESIRSDDRDVRERMKAIAHERRRFGYRRVHILLKREGYVVNHKKLFRLYREEKLAVRCRGSRKRAIGTRAPMMIPLAPNERWSLDFVSDQLTDGRRFAFSRSSMIAPANAWRSWVTPHSRACVWRGNWIVSSSSAASRRGLSATMAGSGAALRQGLRASSRRSHRPRGLSNRQKRTHEWIKLGDKV